MKQLLPLLFLLFLHASSFGAANPVARPADEQILKSAGLGVDDFSLLEFFRQRTASEAAQNQIKVLIRQLGDPSFAVREKASLDLVARGRLALASLEEAQRSTDPEIATRARDCLARVARKTTSESPLAGAAARLLTVHRPPAAAETLLAYLPFAENGVVGAQVEEALATLALRNGKPEPALVKALTDSVPAKRSAAAEALCRAGAARQVPGIAALLHDPLATVRLPVALNLAVDGNRDAVPVLIDLLAELPPGQAWEAEDLLTRLAGHGPAAPPGPDARTPHQSRDTWAAWWKEHGTTADLTDLQRLPHPLGLTLVVLLDLNQVLELDRTGKVAWQISGLAVPLDAQVLPGDRVLITELGGKRITERNFKGDVLWEKKLAEEPIAAQRLPNGNTFIVTHSSLLEVDPTGKEVLQVILPANALTAAARFRDGRLACILSGSNYQQRDARGKEIASFSVGPNVQTTSALDALPGGGILVTEYGDHKVAEYNPQGQKIWEAEIQRPISAVRLPDGHTLVSTQNDLLVELDRAGKVVWQQSITGHPTRVRRR